MLNYVNKLFGSSSQRMLKKYSSTVDKINSLENTISKLSDQDLRDKTSYFKNLLSKGKYKDPSNNSNRIIYFIFSYVCTLETF